MDGSEGFGCTAFELGEKGLVSLGQRGDPLLSLEAQGGHHFWEVQCNFRYHLDQGSLSILRWTSSTIGFSLVAEHGLHQRNSFSVCNRLRIGARRW